MNATQQTLAMGGFGPPDWSQADDAVRKAMLGALSNQDEGIAKAVMSTLGMFDSFSDMSKRFQDGGLEAGIADTIAKTISTSTGLVAYDLQAPAKNLYPFYTPLRNAIPRTGGGTGTATNWKAINGLIGSGWDSMAWVPEGQRSGVMSYSTSSKSASYVTIGEEDAATYEGINAGRGFEDIQARMTFRLMQKLMMKEEMAILGGNASLALGVPGTVTLSASGSGVTLPTATYYVRVVALTVEGYANSSLAAGVATQKAITSAGGSYSYTLNGGSSAASAEASQAVTLGQTLFASVTAILGAVAYAWYVGTSAGAARLEAITTINSAAFTVPLTGTGQTASSITADNSRNPTVAYDGLITTAFLAGSNAYVKTMPTGTAGTGTPLTASGAGSVSEIDVMLRQMWDSYQLSPTVIYVNAQELANITKKVLTNGSGTMLSYRVETDGADRGYQLTAGGVVGNYYNPFAPANAGMMIPIRIHPKVPPGTIIGWADNLPVQYQSNEVPNVAEVKTRQDYYQIDWPIVTRQRQVGVYAEEVLAIYAPFALGVITNIGNG